MSGHNKWTQIKHKKGASDAERSKLFSKLVKVLKVEARLAGGNLNAPGLKSAIEKAKEANMPKDNIDRAIRGGEDGVALETVVYEAYGPGGSAIIIEGLTDSKNRTSAEIKHLLSENGGTLGTPGSALWAFEKKDGEWSAKTTVPVSSVDIPKLEKLLQLLEEHDDVQHIATNGEW